MVSAFDRNRMELLGRGHRYTARFYENLPMNTGRSSEGCEQLLEKTISKSKPRASNWSSPEYVWRQRLLLNLDKELALSRVLPTGSWTHGTAIAGHSDWDYFLVSKKEKPDSPNIALSRISTVVRHNVEKLVDWEIDRPAVRIINPVDNSKLDLVPAFPSSLHEYRISDPLSDTWIASNPTAHIAFIDRASREHPAVRPLIRLMKSWKYANEIPISSLYLEMKTSSLVLGGGTQTKLGDFMHIIGSILRDELRPIQDPSVPHKRLLEPLTDDAITRTEMLKLISSSLEAARRLEAADRSRASKDIERCFDALLPNVQRGWLPPQPDLRADENPMRHRSKSPRKHRGASHLRAK